MRQDAGQKWMKTGTAVEAAGQQRVTPGMGRKVLGSWCVSPDEGKGKAWCWGAASGPKDQSWPREGNGHPNTNRREASRYHRTGTSSKALIHFIQENVCNDALS